MAMTEKERKQQVIADVLEERAPATPLAHALTFALLSAQEGAVQKEYAEAVGISDRTLRKYIGDNRKEYEAEHSRAEAELSQALGRTKQKEMTGSQLDAFIDILIEKATSDTGTTQDRKLLIEFTGLSGTDLIQRNAVKKTKLHWWVLNNLSTLSGYMNTRELGLNLSESDTLYREDRASEQNLQRFVDRSIFKDKAFYMECAYFGLVFMSMYNETEHPDLLLMSDAVRLERLLNNPDLNTEDPLRQLSGAPGASRYAEGKDYHRPTPGQGPDLDSMLRDLFDVSPTAPKSELERVMNEFNEKHPKPPQAEALPPFKREDIVKRVTDKADLLTTYLSVDEWIHALNNPGKKKQY
ncbi:hypothetical protein [Trichococcus alkaliphilus]|uniref:hypothetical protein n=1 Tax=Trichococcus alkaliphilus TaxID=2052943 RepID=UPI000D0ADE6B|nr:hypothetical protein [Trichococcus alkaliphilus]